MFGDISLIPYYSIIKEGEIERSGIEKTDVVFIMKRRKQVIIMINCGKL